MFPASRLLISTVTTELNDLNKGYASFKRLVEGDPNLRPLPPEASPKAGSDPPPSPGCLARTSSTSSSGGGGDSDAPESSPSLSTSGSGTRSEKLASLSRQKTQNRKSTATTGKVCYGCDIITVIGDEFETRAMVYYVRSCMMSYDITCSLSV